MTKRPTVGRAAAAHRRSGGFPASSRAVSASSTPQSRKRIATATSRWRQGMRAGEIGKALAQRWHQRAQGPDEAAPARPGGDLAALDAARLGGDRRPVRAGGVCHHRPRHQPDRHGPPARPGGRTPRRRRRSAPRRSPGGGGTPPPAPRDWRWRRSRARHRPPGGCRAPGRGSPPRKAAPGRSCAPGRRAGPPASPPSRGRRPRASRDRGGNRRR